MRAETHPELALLLTLLDQGFEKAAWHGPNLRSWLRGVDAGQAVWRPAPGRHCIWELALHCAYWKRVARRRLSAEPIEKFPRSLSDWPRLPETPGETAWRADLELLDEEDRQLRAAVATLDPPGLYQPAEGRKRPRGSSTSAALRCTMSTTLGRSGCFESYFSASAWGTWRVTGQ